MLIITDPLNMHMNISSAFHQKRSRERQYDIFINLLDYMVTMKCLNVALTP